MQVFNVKASDCLIIEDSLIGVQAGINAGIEVAVIYDKYSDNDREDINKLSQYQFSNFEEIIKRVKSELSQNIDVKWISKEELENMNRETLRDEKLIKNTLKSLKESKVYPLDVIEVLR